MTTRAFAFQCWLRAHGPATRAQIKSAGWRCFVGKTYDRMIAAGAIEVFRGFNPDSAPKFARVAVNMFRATDVDYTPRWGTPKGRPISERRRVELAIGVLERGGFTVVEPTDVS